MTHPRYVHRLMGIQGITGEPVCTEPPLLLSLPPASESLATEGRDEEDAIRNAGSTTAIVCNGSSDIFLWLILRFGGLQLGIRRNSFQGKCLRDEAGAARISPQLSSAQPFSAIVCPPTPWNAG